MKNKTKDDIVEIIKSNLNHEGWQGVVCLGCRQTEFRKPATANVEIGTELWKCPDCGFNNLLTFRKPLPIFTHPQFGVLGNIIIEAYAELEMNLNFDFEQLEKEKTS